MSKVKKSLSVIVISACVASWLLLFEKMIEHQSNEEESIAIDSDRPREVKDQLHVDVMSTDKFKDVESKLVLDTYVKEHELRMEKVTADRLERERIERERVLAEQKRLEELRKQQDLIKQKELAKQKEIKSQQVKVTSNQSGEWQVFELTFYNLDYQSTGKNPGDPAFGITASGDKAVVGYTVACPKSIPMGTKIHIEGFGDRMCHDRGGAIKGNLLDVLVSSREEAYKLGRIKARVKIYN